MMFQRRSRPGWLGVVRNAVWPKAGWRRASLYLMHRVGRIDASPHEIGAGFAAGVAISFLPLNGLHLVLGAVLALMTRGNVLASAIGTLIGNPWTFPVIWVATFEVGVRLLPGYFDHPVRTEAFVRVMADLLSALLTFDLELINNKVWPIWYPMMVGSIPLAMVAWGASYWIVRTFVLARRRRRERREPRGQPG